MHQDAGIRLRPFEPEDRKFLKNMLRNSVVRRRAEHGIAQPVSEGYMDEYMEYIQESCDAGEECWLLVCATEHDGSSSCTQGKKSNAHLTDQSVQTNLKETRIGYGTITWIDRIHGRGEVSLMILPDYRNRGYGKSAMMALFDVGFEQLGLHKLTAEVLMLEGEESERICAWLCRMGFCQDGYRSHMFREKGNSYAVAYYSILSEEYKGYRKPYIPSERGEDEISRPNAQENSWLCKQPHACKFIGNPYKAPYFWQTDKIELTAMTEAYVSCNREILECQEDQYYFISRSMTEDDEVFENALELIDLLEENDSISYAILDLAGNYVGNLNLVGMDYVNRRFSYNIYILRKYRGRGYAREALQLALIYAFGELGMEKMICTVDVDNLASLAVMQQAGCRVEGRRRDEVFYDGTYHDMYMLGVHRDFYLSYCLEEELPQSSKGHVAREKS